jgi:hypothetical protein
MTDPPHDDSQPKARGTWDRYSNRILLGMALLVLTVGTVAYRLLEDWSWVDAFYFSAVAVTTVGFGDLTPSTDASKLFTVFYIFSGVTIISLWLNDRLKRRGRRVGRKRER